MKVCNIFNIIIECKYSAASYQQDARYPTGYADYNTSQYGDQSQYNSTAPSEYSQTGTYNAYGK